MVNKICDNIIESNYLYKLYINEHILNVKKAFDVYNKVLCEHFSIDSNKLLKNILVHDASKFSKIEFEGYRQYFYPVKNDKRDENKFNIAWKHHYTNNPHHPEYWMGKDMDDIYIVEMLLDWEAMSIKFKSNTYDYYIKERDKKNLSENTKNKIDKIIEIFKKDVNKI